MRFLLEIRTSMGQRQKLCLFLVRVSNNVIKISNMAVFSVRTHRQTSYMVTMPPFTVVCALRSAGGKKNITSPCYRHKKSCFISFWSHYNTFWSHYNAWSCYNTFLSCFNIFVLIITLFGLVKIRFGGVMTFFGSVITLFGPTITLFQLECNNRGVFDPQPSVSLV